MKVVFYILSVATVAIWSYIIGSLTPAVVYADNLTPIYEQYNYIKMYEDGSYQAETIYGTEVTGCIDNTICDNERKT